MRLTTKQDQALDAAFKKNGAWHGFRGSCAGGAYRRMCLRLADMGLLSAQGPYKITPRGLSVLQDIYARRWARHGCMAYLIDLEAVEAALSEVGDAARKAVAKATGATP